MINLCIPLIEIVGKLRQASSAELPPELGDILYEAMKQIEYQGFEKEIPGHKIQDLQFALAALVDEAVMLSAWPGKMNWMDRSLQSRLFGEHLAGINFFNRLERIRQGGEHNLPLLEVYYVCLQLGFQGKYALNQPEELKSMQCDIKNQIDLYKGPPSPRLSCDHEELRKQVKSSLLGMTPWKIMALSAGFLLLLYAGFAIGLREIEKNHAPLIEAVRR